MDESPPTPAIESLLGETGEMGYSGGCLAPSSFKITFSFAKDGVTAAVEDKRLVESHERLRGKAHLTYESYLSFAETCRPVVDAPHVPPTYASSENGAHIDLPTPSGRVSGGGHEMVEGPPLGPFYTAIDGFAEEHFTNDRKEGRVPESDEETYDPGEPAGAPGGKPIRYLLFLIPAAILIAVFCLYWYFCVP